jgi:hypothetical protein
MRRTRCVAITAGLVFGIVLMMLNVSYASSYNVYLNFIEQGENGVNVYQSATLSDIGTLIGSSAAESISVTFPYYFTSSHLDFKLYYDLLEAPNGPVSDRITAVSSASGTVFTFGSDPLIPVVDATYIPGGSWIETGALQYMGQLTYRDASNNSANVITYAQSDAPVPIPAAVWLLGSGLLGLTGIRRRFQK